MNSLSLATIPYTFARKVPQELPPGIYSNIDEIEIQEEPICDFQDGYLEVLTKQANSKGQEVLASLQYYAKTVGYQTINRQMRTTDSDPKIAKHIENIFYNMNVSGFHFNVRLFRTEANDYTQVVDSKVITSRKLSKGDSWVFPSLISTAITNKPCEPKDQDGKLTVFVFEFDRNQDIRGLYLGDSSGISGESEFLLSPGVAKVKEAYKATIGVGYVISKAKFVVVNLKFTTENSNIPSRA